MPEGLIELILTFERAVRQADSVSSSHVTESSDLADIVEGDTAGVAPTLDGELSRARAKTTSAARRTVSSTWG